MSIVAKDVKQFQPPDLHAESPDQTALMAIISRAATDPNFDTDRLMKLLELKERYDATEARKAFTVAMAAFKADPPKIVKNKHVAYRNNKGGTTEYDHATHSEVTEKIAAGLGAHGLSHHWNVEQHEGRIRVTCVITHSLGHSEKVALTATADDSGSKNAIQAVGSTITYLQRYTLLAATGLTSADMDRDDDDGTAAEPMARITEKQIADLEALITEVGADRAKFLRYLKVESLDEILVASYSTAVAALEAKRRA
jgi:hypothetical protein